MTERQIQKQHDLWEALNELEASFHQEGYQEIAGVDEAGRGPLAGPVVAAAVILDPEQPIYGLNDSKKLTPRRRAILYDEIIDKAKAFAIAAVDAERIDEINILQATKEAMAEAVNTLQIRPDLVLLDAVRITCDIPQRPIIKGDAKCNAIAAASILAKESRDRLMITYSTIYPQYAFERHKGYGTKVHRDAIETYGPSPIHRLTFLKNQKLGQSDTTAKGEKAEADVASFLKQQGYSILERNFRLKNFGEIDLITRKGDALQIIEVKARVDEDDGWAYQWSIDRQKLCKLRRLGEYYSLSRGYDKLDRQLLGALCTLSENGEVHKIHFVELSD